MSTTISSMASQYSAAVTYNPATGTTSTGASATSASTTANSTTANPSGQLSADVAAKVTAALQPAQVGIKMLNTALTTGQTKLSALGQVQSAIADFQKLAQGLTTTATTGTAGAAPVAADVTKNVQSFVTAYNALATKLQTLGAGDLKADPGLAQVSAQMTQALRDAGGTSSSGALSKAGITLSSSGQLTVDSTKLSAALAADPSAVANLLGGNGSGAGVMDKVSSKLTAVTSAGGVIGRETASATTALSSTVSKRDALTKALTTQATALAAMYTQQEQAAASGGTTTSLFDMLG
jgi:flagellar hook-associated protein 2